MEDTTRRNVMALIVLVLSALGVSPVATEILDTTPPATIYITGQTEAEVGELVVLDFPARHVEWQLPTNNVYRPDSDTVVLAFQSPGVYQVTAFGLVGTAPQMAEHTITVGDDIVPLDTELSALVTQWCEEAKAPADKCRQLAENFRVAAKEASLSSLMEVTATLNRSIDQEGVREVLAKGQAYLIENYTGRPLEDYKLAWEQIARGLSTYSKGVVE